MRHRLRSTWNWSKYSGSSFQPSGCIERSKNRFPDHLGVSDHVSQYSGLCPRALRSPLKRTRQLRVMILPSQIGPEGSNGRLEDQIQLDQSLRSSGWSLPNHLLRSMIFLLSWIDWMLDQKDHIIRVSARHWDWFRYRRKDWLVLW